MSILVRDLRLAMEQNANHAQVSGNTSGSLQPGESLRSPNS